MTADIAAALTGRMSARSMRRGSVVEYDFSAPARLSREHSRLLEIAFETFGRQWTTQLGTRLPCSSSVTLAFVTQTTYDAYVAELAPLSALVVFSLEGPGSATGVLQIPASSALAHLDYALGGRGGDQPQRALTEIEVTVTTGLCERAISTLPYAFTAVGPISPKVEGLQQDSQLVQAAKATEMVIVATFTLQLGDHVEPITMMMPLAPLQARLAALAPQDVRTPQEVQRAADASRALQTIVPDVPVDVSVRMSSMPVSPDQVLGLAVGDLLRFPHPTGRPLDVMAADVVVARAVTTSRGTRRACLIVRPQEDPR